MRRIADLILAADGSKSETKEDKFIVEIARLVDPFAGAPEGIAAESGGHLSMVLNFPTVALNVIAELFRRKGDCAEAIITTANDLGLKLRKEALQEHNFTCGAESALTKLVDDCTVKTVLCMVADQEKRGLLHPCPSSPERTVDACFHKCPLVMDLLLHTLQTKTPES